MGVPILPGAKKRIRRIAIRKCVTAMGAGNRGVTSEGLIGADGGCGGGRGGVLRPRGEPGDVGIGWARRMGGAALLGGVRPLGFCTRCAHALRDHPE